MVMFSLPSWDPKMLGGWQYHGYYWPSGKIAPHSAEAEVDEDLKKQYKNGPGYIII
jgi:hypothetical protein